MTVTNPHGLHARPGEVRADGVLLRRGVAGARPHQRAGPADAKSLNAIATLAPPRARARVAATGPHAPRRSLPWRRSRRGTSTRCCAPMPRPRCTATPGHGGRLETASSAASRLAGSRERPRPALPRADTDRPGRRRGRPGREIARLIVPGRSRHRHRTPRTRSLPRRATRGGRSSRPHCCSFEMILLAPTRGRSRRSPHGRPAWQGATTPRPGRLRRSRTRTCEREPTTSERVAQCWPASWDRATRACSGGTGHPAGRRPHSPDTSGPRPHRGHVLATARAVPPPRGGPGPIDGIPPSWA